MPKLIDNAQTIILEAAREELNAHPESFSMRNVAKNANVAVGTIYRYYPDKLNLIAGILLDDWRKQYELKVEEMNICHDIRDVLRIVSHLILDYRKKNQHIFQFYKGSEMNMDYPKLHEMFVSEIKKLFVEGKKRLGIPLDDEKDLLISEMILIQAKNKDISYEVMADAVAKII